jgi:hypothetical protein
VPTEFDTLLPNAKAAKRVGATTRTLFRWTSQPELGFPTPCIINGRRYFSAWQIDDWLASRNPGTALTAAAPAPPNPALAIIDPIPPRMTKRRIEAMQAALDRRNAEVDG